MMRALMQGPAAEHPLGLGGVTLIGMNRLTITKVLLTLGLILALALFSRLARSVARGLLRGSTHEHAYFWSRQVIRILSAVLLVVGVISIWFDDPARMATAAGLRFPGIAPPLPRGITAVCGDGIIL